MKQETSRLIRRGFIMTAAAACLALLALATGACESDSDPTAPAESTITVDADPQTLVVPTGTMETAEITATLRSKNGARLPDQEMTFSTTVGDLAPSAGTVILTDGNGQARTTLTTDRTATVTARSGSITGTTQIQTTSVRIGEVLLDVENRENTGQRLVACSDHLELTATALDPNARPAVGVTVTFNRMGIMGDFDPPSDTSDVNGEVTVTWIARSADCTAMCVGKLCTLSFTASAGGIMSLPVTVDDEIP